jgi:hypothetical protein
VIAQRVRQPVVWQDRAMFPGLDGNPTARILHDVA